MKGATFWEEAMQWHMHENFLVLCPGITTCQQGTCFSYEKKYRNISWFSYSKLIL